MCVTFEDVAGDGMQNMVRTADPTAFCMTTRIERVGHKLAAPAGAFLKNELLNLQGEWLMRVSAGWLMGCLEWSGVWNVQGDEMATSNRGHRGSL
ncbi:hypothetical protein Spb1_17550 [Planctopirus ephydatiae]|uniref:Uncharacterized protein n=1 Tax=Planctopirus ephydatiae TaxID=2528019 RepID=A0A518GMN7_9PLAN|nr:hypothetical protein Spb1_17550 [Planctopirus ephydatiae]